MNKSTVIALIFVFFIIFCVSIFDDGTHKVVKISSATSFYVDFNDNNVADAEELIVLDDVVTESSQYSAVDNLRLTYAAKSFAKKCLLGKYVTVSDDEDGKIIITLEDGSDYKKLLIEHGFFISDDNVAKINEQISTARKLDLVLYNKNTKKYHKLDCKHAIDSPVVEVLQKSELPKSSEPCKWCHLPVTNTTKINKYPRDVYETYAPVYKDTFIELYVMDFTKYYYPSSKCLTTACQSLLKEINTAQKSIDFAIYGIDNQPDITNALISAQNRGVKLRWVYDTDKKGHTIYSESLKLSKVLQNNRRDIDCPTDYVSDKQMKDAIMHNKFFIFDDKKVWTGSANISNTDMAGFNANSVVLINSADVAGIYKTEFEKMYSGYFHNFKSKTQENSIELGESKIAVFFSPNDKVITTQIIPLIENAKNYIYVPVFVVTHKGFNEALIKAHNRGVEVKLIVDATSASSKYSSVKYLRENGILVKAENRAGKMHMKSIVIDDKYLVIGSMNFTKSGEKYNDENILILENTNVAKLFKEKFLYFWNDIPAKWLYKNPGAESFNSINSCYDGIDNDFDGKIDRQDDGCVYKKY